MTMSKFATVEDYKASIATEGKPVVHYINPVHIEVGYRATVTPVDHTNPRPDQSVVNYRTAHTSIVLNYDPATGVFETLNTIYKPLEKKDA